jgi:hypothetical protein
MATIDGHSGRFQGVSIVLPPGGLTLGREHPGQGRLSFDEDSDVSRDHCKVWYDERTHRFRITDLGSSNGTFFMPGDRRLEVHQEVQCEAGQLIRIGTNNVFELACDRSLPAQPAQESAAQAAAVQEPAVQAPPVPRPLLARPPAPRPPAAKPSSEAPVEQVVPAPEPSAQGPHRIPDLPRLAEGQRLDLAAVRVPYERFYLVLVWMPTALAALAVLLAPFYGGAAMSSLLWAIGIACGLALLAWMAWKLLMATLLGGAIKVGPAQYPQIDRLLSRASAILGIVAPTMFILQGHGVFEIFVARRFSRRGLLIITSTMLDDLTQSGSSRELMFFIGRQLGLIANGFFDLWFFKHGLGRLAMPFYLAWQRRCHMTADRLGLLVTGELQAAEQALLIITAGSGVAANTNIQAIREQQTELFDSAWSWLALGLSSHPYMIDRIIRLRDFAAEAVRRGIESNATMAIGTLPIYHHSIRALPLMIVHGHDRAARLELENFLRRKFPHVEPILMTDETDAASTLPEKFERLARRVKGALILLTPDDLAVAQADLVTRGRARQNVIVEIGWMWARFGRQKLLLLTRGDLEMPSDLSGVEIHRFEVSPIECAEVVRDFITNIEMH